MISEDIIRKQAGNAAFQKGMGMFLQKKVQQFQIDSRLGLDEISANVEGSTGIIYDVGLTIDTEEEQIVYTSCDCPAFASGNFELCKHCAAVMLHYNQDKMKNNMMAEFMMMRNAVGGGQARRDAWKKPINEEETNKELLALLQNHSKEKLLPLVNRDICGQVRMEAHVVFDSIRYEVAAVEFKIGMKQMYVLKDIFAFYEHLQNRENYAYGAKLSFIHSMQAFDQDSQKIVRFLCGWVEQNKNYFREIVYTSFHSNNNRYVYPKLRCMKLTGKELEDLILSHNNYIFISQKFGVDEEWYIRRGAYQRMLQIEGVNKGNRKGLRLELEKVQTVAGEQFFMTFADQNVYLQSIEEVRPVLDFIQCLDQCNGEMYVNSKDVSFFVQTMMKPLRAAFGCTLVNYEEEERQAVSFKTYLDVPQKNMVSVKLVAVYGKEEYNVFDQSYEKLISESENVDKKLAVLDGVKGRDYYAEMEVGGKVSTYFNAYDRRSSTMVLSGDEDLLYELLTRGIEEIGHFSEVYVSDALKRIKIYEASKVRVGVSVSDNVLKLSLLAGEMSNAQLAEVLSRYDRKKKYYRLKCGDFIEVAQAQYETLFQLKENLHLTDAQMAKKEILMPAYRAFYLEDCLSEDETLEFLRDEKFTKLITNMECSEENVYVIPDYLDEILRPYQKIGFQWLKTLKANGFGGILADDMGLGKTLQVIALLVSERIGRAIIISPASLVFNWNSELERFAPDLIVYMVIGSADQRKEIIENAEENAILLTSYDLLKRDIDIYKEMHFVHSVIDEAQYIKNHNTQAARAVKEIQADFKLALTGTPVENSLSELWSIFDYIMPGFLYSYQRFRKDFELPIVQNQNEQALVHLQKMIGPFILRRLKKNVLTELPDKNEENVFVRMEGEQKELYDAHVKRLRMMLDKTSDAEFSQSKIQILAELTRLRQLCCDPALVMEGYKKESAKLDLCMEMIQNAVNGGHKILLFSQFTSMLDRIEKRLKMSEISYYALTGATSKEKRSSLVNAFQQDETSVFCISLKAGGTGLNLTAADIVIHYDPWWNVAAQNQATDRAHRIGQDNLVTVYRLIAKGTIEENILKLQEKKQELAEQVISGEAVGSTVFNKEELLELLR